MSRIHKLSPRLANQIAAGEVVERPASVIKELVENSLDAGATKIHIEVEKGGTKKLRISDNGTGVAKEELSLALSRHATSKIKDLRDLEAISSLGFRGEALASISSVSRLTLTSKPAEQETAWQANAAGRDMEVVIQPAAHPNGTTIEVKDLFFNTPARRKFLRTDKTEFSHIDEVVRRIALARFDVTFTLTHNGKTIRQYRAAKDKSQYAKRVAMVCGKNFIDHAIEVDCHHDNLHLWGWLAKPSFYRSQNDLCYSYVNGRMMRDKLINHAIRQSYAEHLVGDNHPAFVLFLTLDYREVDVNVHPAKHEVRFHQARFIHDFIFSVCNNALQESLELGLGHENIEYGEDGEQSTGEGAAPNAALTKQSAGTSSFEVSDAHKVSQQYAYQQRDDYVTPLKAVKESVPQSYNSPIQPSRQASNAYQELMTTIEGNTEQQEAIIAPTDVGNASYQLLQIVDDIYGVIILANELRLLSIVNFAQEVNFIELQQRWQQGLVSQPLLLPVSLTLTQPQFSFVEKHLTDFEHAGIVIVVKSSSKIQIRQFPARLRDKNISASFDSILSFLLAIVTQEKLTQTHWCRAFSSIIGAEKYNLEMAQAMVDKGKKLINEKIDGQLRLNSVLIDLTSSISQLGSVNK